LRTQRRPPQGTRALETVADCAFARRLTLSKGERTIDKALLSRAVHHLINAFRKYRIQMKVHGKFAYKSLVRHVHSLPSGANTKKVEHLFYPEPGLSLLSAHPGYINEEQQQHTTHGQHEGMPKSTTLHSQLNLSHGSPSLEVLVVYRPKQQQEGKTPGHNQSISFSTASHSNGTTAPHLK
jgi:hypothetical protein